MEDREWIYTGRKRQGQVTDEWIDKTDAFLERAFGEAAKGASKICCPCSKCANRKRQTKKAMGKHLWRHGFTANYTWWVYHGEANRTREVVRARSTSASPAIRSRLDTSLHQIQAQLEEERRERLKLDARMRAEQQRMTNILHYIQTFGATRGVAPPPSLFAPPPSPPTQFSTSEYECFNLYVHA